MRLDHLLHRDCGFLFQVVNILSQTLEEEPFVVQHLDEVVGRRRNMLRQVKVNHELIESLWFVHEIFNVKDSFGPRQVVLLQVCIDSGLWRPKVWNSRRHRYACSCHHHNIIVLACNESVDYLLIGYFVLVLILLPVSVFDKQTMVFFSQVFSEVSERLLFASVFERHFT